MSRTYSYSFCLSISNFSFSLEILEADRMTGMVALLSLSEMSEGELEL